MDDKISRNEYIKRRTLEIYDSMPQDKALRKQCLKERDEIIELNYAFFGYIASKTFINNSTVTYEDKLQSALTHFCECFWWYKWQGDETHKGYRTDLAFTVFFKPRIGEMIERELNEVKYSIRRSLCMEVGAMIGKHWGKVTYEDLSDPRVTLSADKMASLKAIFGVLYTADIEDHMLYIAAPEAGLSEDLVTDQYDSIEELLVQEMIRIEDKLNEKHLKIMSETYDIPISVLKYNIPKAEAILYARLKKQIEFRELFETN